MANVNKWIEYIEICKTIKRKAKEDVRMYNSKIIREMIMASKSLRKGRRGQNRMIILLDKQGRDIHDQDEITECLRTDRRILHKALQQWTEYHKPQWPKRGSRDKTMGGGGSTKRCEHMQQWPYKCRDIKGTKRCHLNDTYLLSCTLNGYQKDEYPQRGRTLR